MLTVRRSDERGHVDRGWLDARHSFSFSSYYDARWQQFGALRVINEDRVVPTAGFPPHGHRDMEIISYVLAGELKHRDSLGGGGVIRHGEIQVMSAGQGIVHSEANPSVDTPLHLLQIWIEPAVTGKPPSYSQAALDVTALRAGFATVVGPRGSDTPFNIDQDAWLRIAWPAAAMSLPQTLNPQRRYYLHLARGAITANGHALVAGDALMLEAESLLQIAAVENSEILLFDLA